MALYVGMDVHKRFTMAVAMDEDGKVLSHTRIAHKESIAEAEWEEYFSGFPEPPHAALEAAGVSYPIYEAIEPYCASVVLAHPWKTRLMAERKFKTAAIDGRAIAHLRRMDFLPASYIPARSIRDQRELLRHRMGLARIQAGIKNRMRALLTRCGQFYPANTNVFGKAGRGYLARLPLREPYRQELDRFLRLSDGLAGEIQELTRIIHQTVEVTPEAMRLGTIPGVGKYLAALIHWEIGDIRRFPGPAQLVSYCGLSPRGKGAEASLGPVVKEGNKFLRWALVEAVRKHGKREGPLGDFFRRIEARHDSKAARVAAARKLAIIIWHMLTRGEDFDKER